MARFDLHRVEGTKHLLVVCQSQYLDHLPTRFVVPLIPVKKNAPIADRLNPVIAVNEEDHILAPNAAATVRVSQLGPKVGSLAHEQDVIINALDLLISGF